MENLIVAVNCVIPVFICLAVGYIAKMRRVIPEGTYPYINRFSFTVLLSVQMYVSRGPLPEGQPRAWFP